jgi:hypothetical protein
MKGYLFVGAAGLETEADLKRWIEHGVAYTTSLPAKASRGRKPSPKARKDATRPVTRARRGSRAR